ncbi:hypothetical protein RAS12_12210 [Achromobacter seleniivolatilans]|uniref:Phage tail assembly protein n=1 Tax=Achromobacter seleniivolatilans TaxID=3047478 RepID=A0ABY9MBC6_9BURK|nr:hypothetical protein [Achromobacter sp. R39]WMD23102.1 hypothetical protein RAS12_12210 [Achromobacter sp. R39]
MTTKPQQQQTGTATQQRVVLVTGSFTYGVPYGDRRHYDFVMHLPTMGDNIDALEAYPDGSPARIDLAMFASCMVRLGDIPSDDISFELLTEMDPTDVDVIYAAMSEAKKKLRPRNESSEPTENSSSSSESTASQKTASVA